MVSHVARPVLVPVLQTSLTSKPAFLRLCLKIGSYSHSPSRTNPQLSLMAGDCCTRHHKPPCSPSCSQPSLRPVSSRPLCHHSVPSATVLRVVRGSCEHVTSSVHARGDRQARSRLLVFSAWRLSRLCRCTAICRLPCRRSCIVACLCLLSCRCYLGLGWLSPAPSQHVHGPANGGDCRAKDCLVGKAQVVPLRAAEEGRDDDGDDRAAHCVHQPHPDCALALENSRLQGGEWEPRKLSAPCVSTSLPLA